ncbi:ATP/GTP-binding protein [Micromonospora sp. PLK6-60]|uniref:GTP-binding protein n=1 Tax=Micromonospora sp. PLK6-60 TaxID=2873383 RepID=UPI001CA62B90|nr:ATP/GTP-binding protein [Micromonospora sp. PLK6-60]MBY8874221.1 ATP/GTP-binding protein [Micromonospora sp. PLK6-60]
MASGSLSDNPLLTSAKVVIAGGFGVGKTTCVRSISEIPPINTEAWMTAASEPVDRLDPGIDKTTTTVAMDFGRLTIDQDLVLYLFGTPGQPRFWPMWDDLCRGAVGALVLADTRHLEGSFPAVNYFEHDIDLPFVVCVNLFDGVLTHPLDDVRAALALSADVPLTACDARDPASVARALLVAVEHTMARTGGRAALASDPRQSHQWRQHA